LSTLYLGHFVQFFNDVGEPLSGGEVTFYEPGTSTKKDVYTDSELTTPASNPVTLDSAGKATIWLNGDYKARLKDKDGNLIDETDNINPPVDTETSGGNLIANGSFENQGNTTSDASGWTLTAQNDGTIERITTDSYDGEASLKCTSQGNGGGQADTKSFFAVSPGQPLGIKFLINSSVADIRNIVQIRYYDNTQSFLSSVNVYDEDASNPTSWTAKTFIQTPPSNARFAKLRIIGADKSDSTPGDVRFDGVRVSLGSPFFPNVNADVTASDEQMNTVLANYASARVELGGDFDAGEKILLERIGNTVTIRSDTDNLSHGGNSQPTSSSGVIPSQFRPSSNASTANEVSNVFVISSGFVVAAVVTSGGKFQLEYRN